MNIADLKTKLDSEKSFYNVLSTELLPHGKLKIILMDMTISDLANIHEVLSLNQFETNSLIRLSGQTINFITRKI
jgi:hypothetical protein